MSLFPSLAFDSPKSVRLEPDCSLSELMSEPGMDLTGTKNERTSIMLCLVNSSFD